MLLVSMPHTPNCTIGTEIYITFGQLTLPWLNDDHALTENPQMRLEQNNERLMLSLSNSIKFVCELVQACISNYVPP